MLAQGLSHRAISSRRLAASKCNDDGSKRSRKSRNRGQINTDLTAKNAETAKVGEYPTIEAAQREIADDVIEKLSQFLEGERDFDDAMTVEDYILPVDVLPDGSVLDEDGNCFGKKDW
jgi:hypothetical protein